MQGKGCREDRSEQRAVDPALTDSVSLHHSVSRASLPAAMNAAKVLSGDRVPQFLHPNPASRRPQREASEPRPIT